MKWEYWQALYLQTHCTACGLRPLTIDAYRATLKGFREYARFRLPNTGPDEITAYHALEYIDYLRNERGNQAAAIHRQVTILKNFYRAMVAMGYLEPHRNPMLRFPRIKAIARKLPVIFSVEEIRRLLAAPCPDTRLGIRDHAIILLFYTTGIRVSECARLQEGDIDFEGRTIRVTGKGGHERSIPLQSDVIQILRRYQQVRGPGKPAEDFFRGRHHRGMSRNAIYERIRACGRKASIDKRVSPHRLRHTFATHLVQAGVDVVTIRDLLGHRLLSSTQIYLHVTVEYLRAATARLPIPELIGHVEDYLPELKKQYRPPPERKYECG